MIKTVAKISEATANNIAGTSYGHGKYNPVQDANGNWVISLSTAQYLEAGDYEIINWEAPENEQL
jgi:hypothetical protein